MNNTKLLNNFEVNKAKGQFQRTLNISNISNNIYLKINEIIYQ